jgi:hypothetical protein
LSEEVIPPSRRKAEFPPFIPTALSNKKSDKKVKSEQKAVWLDMVSQAVTFNNIQGTINHPTNAFEKSMVPPQEAIVG